MKWGSHSPETIKTVCGGGCMGAIGMCAHKGQRSVLGDSLSPLLFETLNS